jgi:hypothetical protein
MGRRRGAQGLRLIGSAESAGMIFFTGTVSPAEWPVTAAGQRVPTRQRGYHCVGGDWRIDMSDKLRKLSQSIVELAKEIDLHVANLASTAPDSGTPAVVAARLALERLLQLSKDLDELLYKTRTDKLR